MEYTYEEITEGSAKIQIPKIVNSKSLNDEQARSLAPVFYNPVMKMNRDSAILVLRAFQDIIRREILACEPMCGTGIRGIRLAKEVKDFGNIILGDLNPSAIRLAERNIIFNKVQNVCTTRLMEANLLLSLHSRPLFRFDYVDIDPYGSPVPYLDSTLRACKKNGLIALTATDMAPLCGVNVKACIRKYGGRPLRTSYCHEQAIRLLVAALALAASKHETAIWPLFSFVSDHYARLYVSTERGAKIADRCLSNLGYIHHCYGCQYHETSKYGSKIFCPACGSKMVAAGPLWIGKIADNDFTHSILSHSSQSYTEYYLLEIIDRVIEEINFSPGFYDLDLFCSKMGIVSKKMDRTLATLNEMGFKTCKVHSNNRGFKTNALPSDIEEALRRL